MRPEFPAIAATNHYTASDVTSLIRAPSAVQFRMRNRRLVTAQNTEMVVMWCPKPITCTPTHNDHATRLNALSTQAVYPLHSRRSNSRAPSLISVKYRINGRASLAVQGHIQWQSIIEPGWLLCSHHWQFSCQLLFNNKSVWKFLNYVS